MKAIGLARLSGAARGQVRLQTLFYAAGILVSFAALAAVTIGFRGAGIAAGWGFQFQSPIFVTAIAWVMFVLGLSLSGVIRLPGGTWAGMGQGLTQRPGHFGSFFTGLLAVLVATPCTAPFMGAAIAGTLSTTAPITLLIFLTIGLGLASPTLLLLAAPHAADWLPRPGRWMETLRQALAFPMYGAAVWLVWVVSLQAGPPGVLASLAGMLVLALGAWARNAATGAGKLGNILAAAALLGAAAILTGVTTQPAAPTALAARQAAEPFTPARLAALRAEGRPVFVNMTAAWCVTCLINERLALSPPAVRDAFAARHVAYLLGDWTRQDPAITRYLNEQGRDGVPLYIFYPAGGGAPVVLPQLLTAATVLHQVVAGG
jgi:thiol:disulfide interchange protein DsbD